MNKRGIEDTKQKKNKKELNEEEKQDKLRKKKVKIASKLEKIETSVDEIIDIIDKDGIEIEEKEKILAYCSMQTVLDEGDILNVAVSPDRQREGIGYFLVDSMLKMAEMIGIHIVHLEVREGNGTARRLYERLGFKEDGLRKNYYTDPTENAVLMTKMQE